MSREGDWMCSSCRHLNFKKKDVCYNCRCPKFGGTDVSSYRTEILPGDWYCTVINCGAHNYASRTSCHRCNNAKDYYCAYGAGMMGSGGSLYEGSALPGWKPGDWVCTRLGCGVHNYASRAECFKCRTPRDYGGAA
ncbi:hypothetical protein F0562_030069 [Nyssa sinensis]|uniref:RanBP2-type domain-containing protein n=1 Tax=Nyssa sinensis TaxID=561372 RepID=A0A5J5AZ02_9ASTE|nr:hypothetical protein F0562_030069 [Nyssa sinensis]